MSEASSLQWVLLAFFMTPLAEVVMMGLGAAWAHFGYRQAPGKFKELVIQITTVGKERDLVQRTVETIRDYALTMPYQIWVVVEPKYRHLYDDFWGADDIIVVPQDFKFRAVDKARALGYSRLLRIKRGLARKDVKVLFVDDDTLPSQKYVYRAFNGNYDLCQGATVPSRWFGALGLKHFFLSHLDNIRTRNCLIYCSCTQGVTQKPLFVHGEGLCVTGWAEKLIGWDRPIVASDDLVFGTNAAHKGLSWGYFHAAIQLVSPLSFKEAFNQKWRWTWGNVDAIFSREIMPLGAAIFKGFKYVFGLVSVPASITGAVLLLNGIAKVPPQAHAVFWTSMAAWFASYGLAGWINSGGQPNRERLTGEVEPKSWWHKIINALRRWGVVFWLNRTFQTVMATVLTPMSALMPVVIITISLLRGRPENFVMIDKSNGKMLATKSA